MSKNKKNDLTPELEQFMSEQEELYNLPPGLLKSVAKQESAFRNDAISPVGAKGMMQFMDATAKQYKVDVKDPFSSVAGAAKMYSDLLNKYDGDLDRALAGYNWGQGNVDRKGMENMPKETSNYINKIKGNMGLLEKKNNPEENALRLMDQERQNNILFEQQQNPQSFEDVNSQQVQVPQEHVAQPQVEGLNLFQPLNLMQPNDNFNSVQDNFNTMISGMQNPAYQYNPQPAQVPQEPVAQPQPQIAQEQIQQPKFAPELLEGLTPEQLEIANQAVTPDEIAYVTEKLQARKQNLVQSQVPQEPVAQPQPQIAQEQIQQPKFDPKLLKGLTPEQLEIANQAVTPDEIAYVTEKLQARKQKNTEEVAKLTLDEYSSMSEAEKMTFLSNLPENERKKVIELFAKYSDKQYDNKSFVDKRITDIKNFGTGFKQGAQNLVDNAIALSMAKFGSDENFKIYQTGKNARNTVRKLKDEINPSIMRDVGEVAGEVVPTLAIPGGVAIKGASGIAKGLGYGISGAGVGLLTNEVTDTNKKDFAKNVGKNAVIDAATGAVLGKTFDKAGEVIAKSEVGKKVADKVAKITGKENEISKQASNVKAQADKILEDAKKKGLSTNAEIFPEKFSKKEMDILNKDAKYQNIVKNNIENPETIKKIRESFYNAVKDGDKNKQVREFRDNVDELLVNGIKEINPERYSKINNLVKDLSKTKTFDSADYIRNSSELKFEINRAKADINYKNVENSIVNAEKYILNHAELKHTSEKIAREYTNSNISLEPIPSKLKKILDENLVKNLKVDVNNYLRMQKDLNEIIFDKDTSDTIIRQSRELKNALTNDLKRYVSENPNSKDAEAFKNIIKADKFYKEEIIDPYTDPLVKKFLLGKDALNNDTNSLHKNVKTFLSKDNIENVDNLLKIMPKETKQVFKNSVLNNAFDMSEKSLKDGKFGDELMKILSKTPSGTSNVYNKEARTLFNTVFNKEERKFIEENAKLFNNIKLNKDVDNLEVKSFLEKVAGNKAMLSSFGGSTVLGPILGANPAALALLGSGVAYSFKKALDEKKLLKKATDPNLIKELAELNKLSPKTEEFNRQLAKYLAVLSNESIKKSNEEEVELEGFNKPYKTLVN